MADITSATQLALQSKAALEATGAFVVEPDGRVTMAANRGGGYAPPWVWAPALTDDQATRSALSLPSSDPKSPWRTSVPYHEGGPFSQHSQWDSTTGTYEGGIDWGVLLGTIGVGALFAAPALAAAFSSSGAAGGSGLSAGLEAGTSSAAPTTAAAATTAGNTIPNAFGKTAVDTVTSGAPSSGTPSWLVPALKVGAPLAINAAMRSGGGSGSPNGLSGDQNDLLTQLIKMSMTRQQESAPIHQAAMALAGRLAPTGSWGDSPRFQDAVRQTTGPGPAAPSMNPQLADAYARLMKGGM